jgi:hypothetical protein
MRVGHESEPPLIAVSALEPQTRALLIRVGADSTPLGGSWNPPMDSRTGEFAYVPILEECDTRADLRTGYDDAAKACARFGCTLPGRLQRQTSHLDPDFAALTYGDQKSRANQISSKLAGGDLIAFYASFQDVATATLVYALIGLYRIAKIERAGTVADGDRWRSAHTRRDPVRGSEVVVTADSATSGRFRRGVEFCDRRDGAYRIRRDLLAEWGGVTVKDGYVQRSARLPELSDPRRFLTWLTRQDVELLHRNN